MELSTLEIIFQLCLWRCFKNYGNRSFPKIGIIWLEATISRTMCKFLPNQNTLDMTNFPFRKMMDGKMYTLHWEKVIKQTFWTCAKANKRNLDRFMKICWKKLKISRKTNSNSHLLPLKQIWQSSRGYWNWSVWVSTNKYSTNAHLSAKL